MQTRGQPLSAANDEQPLGNSSRCVRQRQLRYVLQAVCIVSARMFWSTLVGAYRAKSKQRHRITRGLEGL
jgi:hypothetical protein